MKSREKNSYVYDKSKIKSTIQKAFREKRRLKIKYYSLSSDEVKYRVVDIYQMHKDCIIAYCHLRKEERTFVIDRIIAATMLEEKYVIPEGWSPESIILGK